MAATLTGRTATRRYWAKKSTTFISHPTRPIPGWGGTEVCTDRNFRRTLKLVSGERRDMRFVTILYRAIATGFLLTPSSRRSSSIGGSKEPLDKPKVADGGLGAQRLADMAQAATKAPEEYSVRLSVWKITSATSPPRAGDDQCDRGFGQSAVGGGRWGRSRAGTRENRSSAIPRDTGAFADVRSVRGRRRWRWTAPGRGHRGLRRCRSVRGLRPIRVKRLHRPSVRARWLPPMVSLGRSFVEARRTRLNRYRARFLARDESTALLFWCRASVKTGQLPMPGRRTICRIAALFERKNVTVWWWQSRTTRPRTWWNPCRRAKQVASAPRSGGWADNPMSAPDAEAATSAAGPAATSGRRLGNAADAVARSR